MRKKNSFLVIVFLLFLFLGSFAFFKFALASWKNMERSDSYENISNTGSNSSRGPFKLDSYGNPFIVWHDIATGNWEIYFTKWVDGVGWARMDGTAGTDNISNTAGYSTGEFIELTDSNVPYIVWLDNTTGSYDVYFKKWMVGAGESVCGTGINDCWTKMDETSGYDNVSNTGTQTNTITFKIGSNNIPYIAWAEVPVSSTEIYFRKWTPAANAWTKMDGTSGTDNVSNNSGSSNAPQIKLDSNNNPYLVWYDDTLGNNQIYFRKWTPGTGWTKMDGSAGTDNVSSTSGGVYIYRFLLDTSNNPYIVWVDSTTGNGDIYFSKWTPAANAWTKMDGTSGHDNISNTASKSEDPEMWLDNSNNPYIVWRDETTGNGDIYLKKWTPAANDWTKMDGTEGYDNVSGTGTTTRYPEIRVGSDNIPKIIWYEEVTVWNYEVYFRKYKTGVGWVKMGDASGTDNVSNNSGFSDQGLLELNNVNYPNILWRDYTDGNYEVYFTRWINDAENTVNISASVEASITLDLPSAEIDLGAFSSANIVTGLYTASISTNSSGGYASYLRADGKLRNATNDINDVTGGAVADGTEAFGVSTTKASQDIAQINDANSDTFYTAVDCTTMNGNTIHANASAITTSDLQYASSDGPVSDDETSLCFAASIAGASPAGVYTQIITLTVVGNY